MRIRDVRACQPPTPHSPADWRTSMGQILVAVDTDAGLTGYGVGGGGAAGVHVARTVLRDLLVGRDPADVEGLWREMYRATLPFGRKGIAIMALSGADLALWDLRGKAAGRPVAELLGGRVGEPIPTYVTVGEDVEDVMGQGHAGYKLNLAFVRDAMDEDEVTRRVAEAREAVGPGVMLSFDAFMEWDLPAARRMAQRLAPYDLAWLEEPLPVDDLAGYAELSCTSPIPIAGGEHESTMAGFGELIDRRLHHVLQPDACWCGGMTVLAWVYERARQAGLRVCPHRGAEVWGLHAIAALDPEPLAETGRPWMTWVGGQPAVQDGTVRLSDRPGFGVEIDEGVFA
jgi:L-rhamnonate dehydratase